MFLFVAFVCIGLLWVRMNRLGEVQRGFDERLLAGSRRWEVLEREVRELRQTPDARGQAPVAEPPEPEVVTATPPPPPPPPIPQYVPPPIVTPPPLPVRPESRLDQHVRESGGWEEMIGGNLLNKLGALVLVIGIALFLSYSFATMGPAGRAFTGLGVSLAILGGGIWLERLPRYKVFSRGVMAAGWGSLYFTSYAMHAMPAARIIEDPTVGVLLMIAVAVGMVVHSLKYRVETLTALSYGTVFAALALSSRNGVVAVALVPLAASILYLARRFEWYGMAVFGAAATYTTFMTRPSEGTPLLVVQSLLLLYWVMFEAFDLLRVQAGSEDTIWTRGLFWVNAVAGLGASAAVWYRLAPDDMWQFCAAGSALYATSMWVRFLLNEKSRYEFALMLSALLAGLAIFAKVPGLWTSIFFLMEAEVLFLAGMYLRVRLARALAWLGFAAAWWHMVTQFGTAPIALVGATVDAWAPPLGVMAVVFYGNRYLSKQPVFGYLASLFVWLIVGYELPWRYAGAGWVVFGAILFELGMRLDLVEFRLQGHAVGLSGTLGLAMHPLRTHDAWALAGGTVVALGNAIRSSRWLPKLAELEQAYVAISGSVGAAILGGLLMTRVAPEPYWGIAMLGFALVLFELGFRRLPAEMTMAAGALSFIAMTTVVFDSGGLQKFPERSVWISFMGVALGCYYLAVRLRRAETDEHVAIGRAASWTGSAFVTMTLWLLVANANILAWWSLFGVSLALGERFAAGRLGLRDLRWQAAVMGVVVSVWSIAMDTPLWQDAAAVAFLAAALLLEKSDLLRRGYSVAMALVAAVMLREQVSGRMLTVSWSLEGIVLLAAGFAVRERMLRLSGLTLLLFCIGKVFFFDLRNLETMYRILSFIGLGVVLLAVSWIYTRFKEELRRLL